MTRLCVLSIGTLLVLSQSHEANAFLPRAHMQLSFEVVVNAVEGPPLSGCETSEEVRSYAKKAWSVAVAEVEPAAGEGWERDPLRNGLHRGTAVG